MAWGIWSSPKPGSPPDSQYQSKPSSQSQPLLSSPQPNPIPTPETPGSPSASSSPSLPPYHYERLSLPFPSRLAAFSILSFSTGFLLGSALGGPEAALRYRAENAHRLPTSTPGWYLYHKSKNYNTILGGVRKGVKTGIKTTGWGVLFLVVEEAFDQLKSGWGEGGRGGQDFTSSVGAGLTMAGVFSAVYHRGDVFTAARTARVGLVGGLGFGLVQDLLSCLKGDAPGYVRWIRRKGWLGGGGKGSEDVKNEVQGQTTVALLREGNRV